MPFHESEGVNIIEFGQGDIVVAPGWIDEPEENKGCISLVPQKPRPIGTTKKAWPGFDEGECPLDTMVGVHTRMVFTKVESIDVVIDALNQVKKNMLTEGGEA